MVESRVIVSNAGDTQMALLKAAVLALTACAQSTVCLGTLLTGGLALVKWVTTWIPVSRRAWSAPWVRSVRKVVPWMNARCVRPTVRRQRSTHPLPLKMAVSASLATRRTPVIARGDAFSASSGNGSRAATLTCLMGQRESVSPAQVFHCPPVSLMSSPSRNHLSRCLRWIIHFRRGTHQRRMRPLSGWQLLHARKSDGF